MHSAAVGYRVEQQWAASGATIVQHCGMKETAAFEKEAAGSSSGSAASGSSELQVEQRRSNSELKVDHAVVGPGSSGLQVELRVMEQQ